MGAKQTYANLDFDRLLEQLSGYAGSELTRALIRDIDVVFHPARIEENLDQTSEALRFLDEKASVNLPAWSAVEDLSELWSRLSAGELVDSQQARTLLRFFGVCDDFDRLLKHMSMELYPRLVDAAAAWQPLAQLSSHARRIFNDDGDVRDSASQELTRIRSKLRQFESQVKGAIHDILATVRDNSGEEALLTIRGNRFVVMMPRTMSKVYAGNIVDVSGSGHSIYFEPAAISGMNADRQHLFLAEDQEVRRILYEFSMQVGAHHAALTANLSIIVRFDYVFARARYARALAATRPRYSKSGELELRRAIHPLIFKDFIPEDVVFTGEKCLVVSGVNAGGKTILLKLLGLYCLMASLGCYVPGQALLPEISGLFADIGDDQSALANLSTFTAHLHFLQELWKTLDETGPHDAPVLVLIDEIGTGTEPGEGAAFAYGIIEGMLRHPVKLAVTTHYDLLKTLAFERDDVKNVCLEFDTEELTPTYRVLDDQPGQSFAFAIARRWGIPADVLDSAQQLIGKEEQKMGSIIGELEGLHRAAERSRSEAAAQAAELAEIRRRNEELTEELNEAKKRFAQHAERVKQDLEHRIDDLLSETKQKLKNKARQAARKRDEFVKAASKTAGVARRQKEEVAEVVQEVLTDLSIDLGAVSDLPEYMAAGDLVIDIQSGVRGEIASVDESKGEAVLTVRGKKLSVKLNRLKKITDGAVDSYDPLKSYRKGIKAAAPSANYQPPERESLDTLDLHGFTIEEASEALDAFISSCLLAGITTIRVMHGVGTGRLRAFVQDYLKREKQISNVRHAPTNEGGVGVTLADFA
ncbi:Smr/MutS family protein [bacterium]|nr:Smr/MutS family protein [bacterium]